MITDNYNIRGQNDKPRVEDFGAIEIKIASPEVIRGWSHGEVKKGETNNYRSGKAEPGGLLCERIFGPVRDWECSCGAHKGSKNKGIICSTCGVEVTKSDVRRERMGHIELAVPVSHTWFIGSSSPFISMLLNLTATNLSSVIYYENYIVIDAGDTPLQVGQILSDEKYEECCADFGDSFTAEKGAKAIRTLLERLDLEKERAELENRLKNETNQQRRRKLIKHLRVVEGFINKGIRPEYMILTVLPVIPPDIRPLMWLKNRRFAKNDLIDLYLHVIRTNNRLKNMLKEKEAPREVLHNEMRLLQESVDNLIENHHHYSQPESRGNGRLLKSLSDVLKGKQGRFRMNLLGKRVDYSGRSVIVVGPELKIYQCGIPKRMAMVLFEPFIIQRLIKKGYAPDIKSAKKMIERGELVIWDVLAEVTKGHPVMLNRAPTLHRLSIQAFDPILIEGLAIRLHPLVCTAFNADFDGDQMAVHVPLSTEAQLEAQPLMFSPHNIFSPANGKPIVSPTHDIALGCYYLTIEPQHKERAKMYRDYFEAIYAMQNGYIGIHDAVKVPNPDFGRDTTYGDKESRYILTSPGRCIFNEIWDKRLGFFNSVANKKQLGDMIKSCYLIAGKEVTVKLLDDLKDLGYKHSTLSGLSISATDVVTPEIKGELVRKAREDVAKVVQDYDNGLITMGERHSKVIDIWSAVNNKLSDEVQNNYAAMLKRGEINPVYAMLDSGARGSKDQIRQLAGMRGLMAKPNGEVIERPIISNFRDGLSVLEYFISTHGARKGLSDTALKTADSGYMTRRLVDVAQDIICREEDCGTTKGVWTSAIIDGSVNLKLYDRIVGRFSAQDVRDPVYSDGRLIIAAGEEFTPEKAELIEKRAIQKVLIRSALTCETEHGVCVKCYGRNLASDRLAHEGDALGIIAAQSIGEPGTQLTMRTFHIGGSASTEAAKNSISARNSGVIKYVEVRTVKNKEGKVVVVNKNGRAIIYDPVQADRIEKEKREQAKMEAEILGSVFNPNFDFRTEAISEVELESYVLEPGYVLSLKDGDKVAATEQFVAWDPSSIPVIVEESGIVKFADIADGITLERAKKGSTGDYGTVIEHRDDLSPQIVVVNAEGNMIQNYPLQAGAVIMVRDGQKVTVGTQVARVPRQGAKNKDITGGLPRIAELFDAHCPKEVAEIARIDGVVSIESSKTGKSKRRVLKITDPVSGKAVDYPHIQANRQLVVSDGDHVKKGQKLTEGMIVPATLLEVCGASELQRHLINEIQMVYCSQGVEINDKHVEIIIRQMMQNVRVTSAGDTCFAPDETVSRIRFEKVNAEVVARGGEPAQAKPILQGITAAALGSDSFISAVSFQKTVYGLAQATVLSDVDKLRGFKENVIVGHMIPAGTGAARMKKLRLKYIGTEIEPDPTEDGASAEEVREAETEWRHASKTEENPEE
ncbi:MAG: DNA-directed RNA polymerase subunit beta' [Victivallaceae bacterium]|nr:DNA-directed RNA polymerase subunit beta' [Victivallaceae bacterium]